ncbi:hypothetical protein [Streptomyces sp. NPDC058579]|uniref:hypothetical protein n=1 Tax=Streptomyces sp. NPDC058579 TaxID=3346548 RepID=UPI00365BC532
MSASEPFWDADNEGWSGGAWGGIRPREPRPRLRQAREPGRERSRLWEWLCEWLASRRDGIGRNKPPAHWNQRAQGWDTGAQDTGAARPEAWPRRWTTLALLPTAAVVALLADWWTAVLFLVWAHLVRTGVAAVRRRNPPGADAGAIAGRGVPAARAATPSTPGRAFAEGVLAVLVPSRVLGVEPVPVRPFAEPLPLEGDLVEVEESVRDVVARITAAAARADEDPR